MRRLIAGTGWKMNLGAAATLRYAEVLCARIASLDVSAVDIYVLPSFTSLPAAAQAFSGSPVAWGGQNMHWDEAGNWTGEISAAMLVETGCRYVELAHSERLYHCGENYEQVRRKLDRAMAAKLSPILCLGETADEKSAGRADEVLAWQMQTALAGQPAERIPEAILAYEPRWAIGRAEAASPAYIAERHAALRENLRKSYGHAAAEATRIIYGGSVTPKNGRDIVAIESVDGLFVGRAAWTPEGFARIIEIIVEAAAWKRG